jgi:uncharacterized protein (TIGR00266 family)
VRHSIKHGNAMGVLEVHLDAGESIVAEAGAMVAKDRAIDLEVALTAERSPGFLAVMKAFVFALLRKVVGGESFIMNHFTARAPGRLVLAPTFAGSIERRELAGGSIILRAGAYLASTGDVHMALRWGGLRALFAREGLFFLEMSGTGSVWFSSYGAVEALTCVGTLVVDNGHILAFDPQLDFSIRAPGGGLLGLAASGEGLVCEFQGRGTVWVQTRNVQALVSWISPLLP